MTLKTFLYPAGAPEKGAPIFHNGKVHSMVGPHHGKLSFNASHPVGKLMSDMNFKPWVWQYGPKLQAAYLPPLGPGQR